MKVGVLLPVLTEPDGSFHRYGRIRDIALAAERDGLDSIWVADHTVVRYPSGVELGIWEAWTMLTALAEATSRIELGTIVVCTAFRNPALLAKMTDTLQEVSAGRITLGLGAGWHEPGFSAFGYPFDHLASRFEEAMSIVAPLLRDGAVDVEGRFAQARNAVLLPRSPHRTPILAAGTGPRMLRIIARQADAWNTAWHGWPGPALADRVALLEAACAEVDRDPAEIELSVGLNVGFPELGFDAEGQDDRERYVCGSVDDVVEALHAHEAAGSQHLVIWPRPLSAPSYELLGEAVRVFRSRHSTATATASPAARR